MPTEGLSQEEKTALRGIYRRDVKFWDNWGLNVKVAKREGKASMGLSWVILRFKPGPELPQMRAQMNNLYLVALDVYAGQYGLNVCIDPKTNKVMLYDLANTDPEWLSSCMLPVREAE
jgi:hypothetical protein